MMRKRIVCMAGIVVAAAILIVILVTIHNGREESGMPSVYNEIEKLQEWFPALDGIVSAEYEVYEEGKNEFHLLPGPTPFTAKGLITINDETAAEYAATYQWTEAKPDVQFRYLSPEKMTDHIWLYSRQFDSDKRPRTFYGDFWFDGKAVLFNVGK